MYVEVFSYTFFSCFLKSDESGTTLLPSLATTGLLEAHDGSDEDVMKDTAGVVFVGEPA